MSKAALHIKDLNVEYILKKGSHPAVKNISFQVEQGEIFGLVGESGSGKSTVVQALIRTLPPPAVITGGEVIIDKIDVLSLSAIEVKKYRWKQISIVMQSALNALNPVMTVEDQIKDVLEIHKNITGIKADEKVEQLLRLVDVSKENAKSYPHQLSGGMRQRIVIAIALALTPPLIIMDEPTTALDVIVEREILSKIIQLRKELDFTILFITHDLNLLLEFADRIAIMKDGEMIEMNTVEKIKKGGKHSYTKKLIGALPSASGPRQKNLLPKPKKLNFSKTPILEVQNLSKTFQGSGLFAKSEVEVVKNVNFEVFQGEIVALVGESGSGKSTIARLISRLIRPTSGNILLDGRNTRISEARKVPLEYRKAVQMVFQDPFASLNSVHTVYHHLSRPLTRQNLYDKKTISKMINQSLEEVGLSPGKDFAKKFPHEMSGGERQRVAIARALCIEPQVIIADEPTSMLDVSIRMEILEIFAKLRIEKNLTIIFITHDLASARYLADRILVLSKGTLVEQNKAEDLIKNPESSYTKKLVRAASPGWLNEITK
ncbi:MAG: ABC transporter ATP-binding protein [bacterium]|jgi:peptide/nickel transport system ATP-binding protein|tara:strand:- start:107 stop:1747 length:1641 start_codon:yes stop_codon:yes gene_type:complete